MAAVNNQDNRLARHHNHPNGQETSFRISFTKKLPEKIKKAIEEGRRAEPFHFGDEKKTFVERRKEVSNSGGEVIRHLENSFIELKIPDRIRAKFPGVLNGGCYVKIERTIEVKEKQKSIGSSNPVQTICKEQPEVPVDAFHPNSMANIFGLAKRQFEKNGNLNLTHDLTKTLDKEFETPTRPKIRPRFVEESSVDKINDVRGKKRGSNDKRCRSKIPSKDQKEVKCFKSIDEMGNRTILDDKIATASRFEDFSATFFATKEMESCRNKSASKYHAETQSARELKNYYCSATTSTTTTTVTTTSSNAKSESPKVGANLDEGRQNANNEERHPGNATKNVECQSQKMRTSFVNSMKENGQSIFEKMTSQFCEDDDTRQCSKRLGSDYDRIDFSEGSLLRSLLTDKKCSNEFSNWTPTLEANSDQDLDLENIMVNILDLRDDDLDRLLVRPDYFMLGNK